MRKWINGLFRQYFKMRMKRIEGFMEHPHETQERVFNELIEKAGSTEWGKKFDFSTISSAETFAKRMPVQDYESLKPFIERMMYGEESVLWPGQIKWFSKSSGTTSDKSKFIPVSMDNLKGCHIAGSWDAMALFYDQRPDARQFEQKSLMVGGSLEPFAPYPDTIRGDVSAVMINNTPLVAKPFLTPDFETALMKDFEEKIERMARITSQEEHLVTVAGVPTWTVVLFRRILELTGKQHMLEVWPELQGYIHGGVSFTPYREQFKEFLPSPNISYQEIYNASEGFFGAQNVFAEDGMLLLLDNGVFYEFLPMEEWDKECPKSIGLHEVELRQNYALIITTNAGLWRYMIGDTIQFVSLSPYKVKVTGRTQQFVNAFGEEVMVDNTDQALAKTCQELDAVVLEYMIAPIYFEGHGKGGHQWLVEFEKKPQDLEQFANLLDQNLQKINSDYEAKRYKNMALVNLQLDVLPPGTFMNWMKSRGKFGGQHKVPRLSNHRKYIEAVLDFAGDNQRKS